MSDLIATPEQLSLSCDEPGRGTGTLTVLTDPPTPNLSVSCTIEQPNLAGINAPQTTDANGEATFTVTCTGCGTTTLEFRVPGKREWKILKARLIQMKTRNLPPPTTRATSATLEQTSS